MFPRTPTTPRPTTPAGVVVTVCGAVAARSVRDGEVVGSTPTTRTKDTTVAGVVGTTNGIAAITKGDERGMNRAKGPKN